jgi:regulatory protein
MDTNYQKLVEYALRLISRKRYTEKELKDKLILKKKDKKTILKTIERLKELNYINDFEYARDFISDRLKFNPKGVKLLKLELKIKGVNEEIIKEALKKANINEFKYAFDLIERKKKYLKKFNDTKKRQKIIWLLSSRGFSSETIYKILEKC